ncbi:MAG TPA: protein kinase [Trichormus sp.]
MESSIELAVSGKICGICGLNSHALGGCPGHDNVIVVVPKVGDLFEGRFLLTEMIAAGGMGVVFKARQQELNRTVAIKMLQVANASGTMVRRFQQEAQALANLQHPNIVGVSELGVSSQSMPYMVMEYLDAIGLDRLIAETKQLRLNQAINIFLQVCEGLHYVHSHGILHRDMKPSNIMLMLPIDENPRVKLVDFGIAKIIDSAISKSLTQTGEVFGSPLYMSPEQAKGLPVDERSDIYSVGCLMYEALTGIPPLNGQSVIEIVMKVVSEVPKPINAVARGVKYPNALEAIVSKLLEKDPNDRYQSIEEVHEALQNLSDASRTWYHVQVPTIKTKRDRAWALALAAFLVITVALNVCITKALERREMPTLSNDDGMQAGARIMEKAVNTDPGAVVDLSLVDNHEGEVFTFPVGKISPKQYHLIKNRADKYVTTFKVDNSTKLEDEAIADIGDFPLISLDLNHSDITSKSIDTISRIHTLEELNLADIKLTPHDWQKLVSLTHLRILNVHNTKLRDESIALFRAFPRLTRLDISNNRKVTDAGIEQLVDLKLPIIKLDLAKTGLTNKSLPVLAQMPDLSELWLTETDITDDGIAAVNSMPNLRALNLRATKITDKGLCAIHAPKLLKLWLGDNQSFSQAGVRQFHNCNPDCVIVTPAQEDDPQMMF